MSRLSEKLASLTPKTRQYIMLGGAGTVFLGLVAGSVTLWDNQPAALPTPTTQQQATNISAPGSSVDPKDVWMTQSAAQMKQMDDVIKDLKQQMTEMGTKGSAVSPTDTQQQSILPPLPPIPPASPAQPISGLTPTTDKLEPVPVPQQDRGIASFDVSSNQEAKQNPASSDTKTGYVPAGSFVRVALLGGLDAPTGGQAQTNPHPILMRTQDNAFLPNRYRFEIKECFILASSYGDISSERAFARLENLSCVRRDGKAVDMAVKGYVVGEDGKAGMRGRLISKQGQILANALLAGIGSGIGQAFQNSATTQSISPLGSTSTVNSGQQFKNGISSGVGKTLDRLSQYYIDLAEKLFPVIEIDAGRTVEVVFTKGFAFGDGLSSDQEGTYTDIWIRGRRALNKPLDPSE
ncbi:MAG: TraB/VirB10 family protein [Gammaproteobacteria bacterium]|nr:TraB/VirB10 family protein [Gammaproteobacteria bacterium]